MIIPYDPVTSHYGSHNYIYIYISSHVTPRNDLINPSLKSMILSHEYPIVYYIPYYIPYYFPSSSSHTMYIMAIITYVITYVFFSILYPVLYPIFNDIISPSFNPHDPIMYFYNPIYYPIIPLSHFKVYYNHPYFIIMCI